MIQKKKVLFICTGNSCRSQMAEGLLKDMARDSFDVFSAGTHPSKVHPMSTAVMAEDGIDISEHTSDFIDDYLNKGINIVITVCDSADSLCPSFPGDVERIHWSIDDPFQGWDIRKNKMDSYRETRDILKKNIKELIKNHL
ncbi:MAG: arsenate reductase ArsC [Candidatus Marinimicrobia bacterium]|jgi:arsenate reductase|nr:arsenate reductase ArsC [Candidatus Neomarinimicrobiota bacterium]MDP6261759.1 arsenate reductase ArsC [Candidatus Neomarinimicrobiota bacterium]MDP7128375.1 arsenate reductase ArsC [Candidatus Neomarinimicrobiota bacterium]MDP7336548.1 arsenate reductase ArsC [Candidatus Neomarinimicrobiota bacterium]MDP7475562.1 arsenate reductase ArsC [Candidatus Neomarinimicrobiota bacterium]|tara:strand:- start:3176 stop:3598 length:423 start_codon:yes stop_codon:yes gene_type:complete